MSNVTAIPALEEWSSVKGFEGLYEISTSGCVIGIARTTEGGSKKQTTKSCVKSHISNGNGYMTVRLCKDGKQKISYVHRLVLQAFVGDQPEGMNACHNDGNRANNELQNLRWDTIKNNHMDKVLHGTVANGELAPFAKLTKEIVLNIRARILGGEEQKEIASSLGISQPTVSDINTRRTWKHI